MASTTHATTNASTHATSASETNNDNVVQGIVQMSWVEICLRDHPEEFRARLARAAQRMSAEQRKVLGITTSGQKRKTKEQRSERMKCVKRQRNIPESLQQVWDEFQEADSIRSAAQQRLEKARRELEEAEKLFKTADETFAICDRTVMEEELKQDNDFTRGYQQLMQFKQTYRKLPTIVSGGKVGGQAGNDVEEQLPLQFHNWAKKQRQRKKLLDQGHEFIDHPNNVRHHIRALDEGGFVWMCPENQWQSQFDKLEAFQLENGHTCVSKSYPSDVAFGAWVHRQRYFYKLFHEGKPNQLTEERIDLLNSIGFFWSGNGTLSLEESAVPKKTTPRSNSQNRTAEEFWQFNYEKLQAFKERSGHLFVSSGDTIDNTLRDFVAYQRREYKKREEGKPSSMTEERVRLLVELGFHWEARSGIAKGKQRCTLVTGERPATV
jgi:hypothetical protein